MSPSDAPPQDPTGDDDRIRKRDKLKQKLKESKSWLTSTKYFQRIIDKSFDMIDVDKSGDVTLEELHAGLLLIHLQMAEYVGAPATKPASKEYVKEMFTLLDVDNSGVLNKDEFTNVMKILFSQVFTRILLQWGITLMIVPITSQYIIKHATSLFYCGMVQGLLGRVGGVLHSFGLGGVGGLMAKAIAKVPMNIWQSMQLTGVTVAQTSVVLPWSLGWVEEFFKGEAKKKLD